MVRMVFSQLSEFATIITAGLGLLLVSQHLNDRSIKMVFTKPCRPEIWLLSILLSAALVSFVLYAGIFLISSVLFVVWDIPFQWGIAYLTVNEFFQAVSLMSYLTFLAVIL